MKLPLLMFAATFLGSIPVVAVVTHQRDRKQEPSYAAAVPTATAPSAHGLMLFDRDGYRVATCDRDESTAKLTKCKLDDGYDIDDVMNAWLRAYEDR